MIALIALTFQMLPLEGIEGAGPIRLDESEYRMRMNVSLAPIALHGDQEGSTFGSSISGDGDVNGDGLCDLLIGSPWNDQNGSSSGRVDLFLGSGFRSEGEVLSSRSDVTFLGLSAMDSAGTSVGIVGDINGDGMNDIVICDRHSHHPSSRGSAKVFLGRSIWPRNVSLESCDLLLAGCGTCPSAELEVSRCGDFNNDGFDDIFLSNTNADPDGQTDGGKAYVYFGGKDVCHGNRSLEDADLSIKGSSPYDYLGSSISELGDMNRDGFDDIVIGAQGVNWGAPDSGRAYVFFGRADGPGKNVSCDTANVIINGETSYAYAGGAVSGGEDLNGDGVNDIVIGAPYHTESSGQYPNGKVYILFGKIGPWPDSIDLSDADASYLGEMSGDYLGGRLDLTGDMDGDGLSELLIASPYSVSAGRYLGQAYLVKGRSSGWEKDHNITTISFASFMGEEPYDYCSSAVAGVGDLDLDGGSDMAISSPFSDHLVSNGGAVYIFPGMVGFPPEVITSLDIFKDYGMAEPGEIADKGEAVYIRLTGIDRNSTSINSAVVNVSLNLSNPVPFKVSLRETGRSTGTYTGKFLIPTSALWGEKLTVVSTSDPDKYDCIKIDTPVRIFPRPEGISLNEGDLLDLSFSNVGWCEMGSWDFECVSDWIEWSGADHRLSGKPDNARIGDHMVSIALTDGSSHNDSITIKVRVKNVPPVITTQNVMVAEEDSTYIVDYSCDEDEEGPMVWGLASNATFLEMISDAGILRGTPTNDDVGTYWVRVWVEDGKGGRTLTNFNLTVINTNDPPTIIAQDITKIDQGIRYKNTYEADDPDIGDHLTWTLDSEAKWLSMNGSTLSGTPGPMDIGMFKVTLSVTDRAGETDKRTFDLEVVNVNDRPVWTNVPSDLSILNGKELRSDVNATDDDPDDEIVYTISTTPYTDMTIDRTSGLLTWSASTGFFERPPYVITVKLSASDGTITISHTFKVTVTLSQPPVAALSYPSDGTRLPFRGSSLRWSASDPDNDEMTFDVYIGENKALVSLLDRTTLFIEDLEDTEMGTEGLTQGKTYYWTVIPSDGSSHGSCSNKVRSFKLNSPPSLKEMEVVRTKAGKEVMFFLKAMDNDPEDRTSFRFSIKEGPAGMTIDDVTGMVKWVPTKDQIMLHRAVFVVNDSVETSETVLTIEVLDVDDGEGTGMALMFCIATGVVILLIAIIVGTMVVIRKMRERDGGNDGEDVQDKAASAIEQANAPRTLCAVSLDATEAHRNDQSSNAPRTYEELYGAPAPEKEEALTTRELRDYIKGSIEELERITEPEE
jgi:hypothetical protein